MRPPALTSCPPWQILKFFSFLLNKYQLNHNLIFCCLIICVDSIIRHCDQTNIFKTFNKNRKWMTISCKVWWFIYVMHEGRGHKMRKWWHLLHKFTTKQRMNIQVYYYYTSDLGSLGIFWHLKQHSSIYVFYTNGQKPG